MTHTPINTQENVAVTIAKRGPSIPVALAIAGVGGVIAIASTIVVIRNSFSTSIEAIVAAVALLAFGVTAYGLIQAVLAVVDSAGERRMRDREVSERRKGDRARKPKDS
jgi:uncharacterized membrane protein